MSSSDYDIPVTCLVLEDDKRSREWIIGILRDKFSSLHLVEADNLEQAEMLFHDKKPRILLLDINLPDGNSFVLLETLYRDRKKDFEVIFITAYADYAVEAFRYSALDFLLKPIAPKDLEVAVLRVLENLERQSYHLKLETFFHNYALGEENSTGQRIVLKNAEQIHVVEVGDIFYTRADNNYTEFILGNEKRLLASQPLKAFEEKLVPLGFMRVHQSYLVNLKHVVAYRKKQEYLILQGDMQIPVSQSKKSRVMAYFNSL